MDLRKLRAFSEVVQQGGFTRAAKTLFATQSTVSKAVKQLEDELGVALLDRSGRRIAVTEAGEVVLRRATAMLAERDDLLAELDELQGLKRGVLRLGLPIIGSSLLFSAVIAKFHALYPGVDIKLVERGSKRLEDMVLAGDVDLGATLLPVGDAFAWQEVRCEPVDLLVRADHPLAGRDRVRLEELRDQGFILFGPEFALHRVILDACRRSGFTPEVAVRTSQIDFLLGLAAAGMGVGFLPRMIAEQRRHPQVRNVPVQDPHLEWRLALIWRRGGYLTHAAQAWMDLVRSDAARP